MAVTETFFAVEVQDMERAKAFYVRGLGATVLFATPQWTSLMIARVRIGLSLNAERAAGRVGLHFAVSDLNATRAQLESVGGAAGALPMEVAPGVTIAMVSDTEGNTFTLRQG